MHSDAGQERICLLKRRMKVYELGGKAQMNVYTHLGLEDASEELERLMAARKELDKQKAKRRLQLSSLKRYKYYSTTL